MTRNKEIAESFGYGAYFAGMSRDEVMDAVVDGWNAAHNAAKTDPGRFAVGDDWRWWEVFIRTLVDDKAPIDFAQGMADTTQNDPLVRIARALERIADTYQEIHS